MSGWLVLRKHPERKTGRSYLLDVLSVFALSPDRSLCEDREDIAKSAKPLHGLSSLGFVTLGVNLGRR